MIEARIRKNFPAGPESRAFSIDVQFEAPEGVTVLFGPSGSGKTFTLDAIAGFARPDAGRILLDDSILFDGETGVNLPPQARRCGYVFQNYALFPHMTLRQNLEFAAAALPARERGRRVTAALEQFQLEGVGARRPGELSGGQQQRGSIARALLRGPRVLLLDEPAQGLDSPLRQELYSILRGVRAEYKTPVVLVTHDLEECFELGDRMHIYQEGRIIQSGAPRQIVERPASAAVARQLGIYTLLAAEITALDPGRNTSRLRIGEHEIESTYLGGHLRGDRVTLCLQAGELRAKERAGSAGANEIPAKLERVAERPHAVLLHFAGGITAEISRAEYEGLRHAKEWVIEFPRGSLRIL